jgi:hypothetical protein
VNSFSFSILCLITLLLFIIVGRGLHAAANTAARTGRCDPRRRTALRIADRTPRSRQWNMLGRFLAHDRRTCDDSFLRHQQLRRGYHRLSHGRRDAAAIGQRDGLAQLGRTGQIVLNNFSRPFPGC